MCKRRSIVIHKMHRDSNNNSNKNKWENNYILAMSPTFLEVFAVSLKTLFSRRITIAFHQLRLATTLFSMKFPPPENTNMVTVTPQGWSFRCRGTKAFHPKALPPNLRCIISNKKRNHDMIQLKFLGTQHISAWIYIWQSSTEPFHHPLEAMVSKD